MVWSDDHGHEAAACKEWVEDKFTVSAVTYGVSYFIVGVNFILKIVIVKLVKFLRLETVSDETAYIMAFIFAAQFINTGVLTVLNDANFDDFDGGNGLLSKIFVVGT